MTVTALDREVENRLRDHEARYTRGRRAVVGALAEADGPRSAAELHSQIGAEVPLSSLYRSLVILEEAGVVTPHYGELTRYELAEWLAGHHHHLVCVVCGAVADIEIPGEQEAEVHRLVEEIAGGAGFTAYGHALEIDGRCERCT